MNNIEVQDLDSLNASRLERYRSGEAIQAIAKEDGITAGAVRSSIKQAKALEHEAELMKFVETKLEGTVEDARRQEKVRKNYPKIVKGIKRRLDGKRTIVAVNKITGERTKHTFNDPDRMISGVRILMKLLYGDLK